MVMSEQLLVLVVDDESLVRSVIARELRGAYQVLEASGFSEALHILESRRDIRAVVADLGLGVGPDGVSLLARARSLHPSTVRVLMSGELDRHDAAPALASGTAQRFLSKPWSSRALRQTLAELLELEPPRAERSAGLAFASAMIC
jgi:CheY-like chemotaxis protein